MRVDTFHVSDFKKIKAQLLIWGSRFSSCAFLDNNLYQSKWQRQECLLAAGSLHSIKAKAGTALDQLQSFMDHHPGKWLFGHLGYGLKNEIETGLQDPGVNPAGFDDLHFFVPGTVIRLFESSAIVTTHNGDPFRVWNEVLACDPGNSFVGTAEIPALQPCIPKAEYLKVIRQLKEHIHRGDCYEINFCQEFAAGGASVNPVGVYQLLNELSPNPFACYYRVNDAHLMCASPERYLMRRSTKIFSQPIKGTAARIPGQQAADAAVRVNLQQDPKERSENVMIVDLVRNDLSRVCGEGTVNVEELFGVYTYPNVHQMISTISGELQPGISFTDIIRATFPMGSMTGAPKKRVMELIAAYECGSRGIFSGAVGYLAPDGDFDFNVVIRSLQYNAATKYLSYWVGGGITWNSEPEREYEECLVKAAAIKKVLQNATLSL